MMQCLAIFAAGKSSRFGGFPKAFCDLGGKRNVENTIGMAKRHFKKIYLIVNKETYASGITDGLEADVVSIVTGQGDADSILKALKLITCDEETDTIAACWGDAVFLSDEPFMELETSLDKWSRNSPALVGCSMDENPYAWFDIEGVNITKSHFKKREKEPAIYGLHDQSVFAFHTAVLIDYLTRRKGDLGLDIYDENTYDPARGEMGLLDAFTWFFEQPNISPAEYCRLSPNRVMSFNTPVELETITSLLKEKQKSEAKMKYD